VIPLNRASRPPGPPPDPTNKWLVAATVLTGTFMAVLDSSIVNVALANMSGTLGASLEEITWVVTGYILAQVIVMPIIALLASRFGRKRLYLVCVALFTGASMACGLARTLPMMVFFRIFQGVGGGVVMTASQAILRESFPVEEQGMAMGIYGMGAVVAPAIGPTLGGWLMDRFSWPWIFYVNVPVGIVNVLLVSRFIQDPAYLERDKRPIDWLGVAFMTVGLGSFQLMLEKGQDENWFESSFIVALTALAVVAMIAFVLHELSVQRPAVELRILRNPSFTSATIMGGVLGAALNASLFLLPIFLQRLLGYPAMDAGLALMPRSAMMALLMPVGGWLYNRVGPRILVGSGLVVSAYSFWALSHLTSTVGYWDVFFPQMWQGVGFSPIFVALSTAALSAIPKPKMTAATGLYNVVRQVAGSVGIAIAATSLSSNTARYAGNLMSHVTVTGVEGQRWLASAAAAMAARGADPVSAQTMARQLLYGNVIRQAQVLAYNHVFQVVAITFALVLPMVLMLRRAQGSAHVEVAAE
jgi:DHA2 family multidrug resistance protein